MANGMWCLSIRRKEKKTMFRAIVLRMLMERAENFLLCLIDNIENTVILIIMPSIFFIQKQCHRNKKKNTIVSVSSPYLMFSEYLTKSNWTRFQYQPYSHNKLNKFARCRLPEKVEKKKENKEKYSMHMLLPVKCLSFLPLVNIEPATSISPFCEWFPVISALIASCEFAK